MKPETYNKVDTIIKIVGLVFAIFAGSFAFVQYRDAQEREFKKIFYEKQLGVVSEVFDTLAEVDSAKTEEGKRAAAAKFWMIYQGKGRTFLDQEMFQAMKPPAEYIAGCITKIEKPKYLCENYTAAMSVTGFAPVARRQLSEVWHLSLSEIGKEDPWSPPQKQ